MGSTSNCQSGTDGVYAISETFTFDLNQGSADIALRRKDLSLFDYLEVPDICNEPPSPTSPTDLFQIQMDGGRASASDSVPMQLLNQAEQEKADLLLVYPKAKVEGDCISVFHYILIVKLFLSRLMLSQYCIEGVPHPKPIARLLCRLSRELKSVPSFESYNLSYKSSDPADYEGFLSEMLKDMEEYIKVPDTPSLPDGYVYVRRETNTYALFLLAAATELNSSSS